MIWWHKIPNLESINPFILYFTNQYGFSTSKNHKFIIFSLYILLSNYFSILSKIKNCFYYIHSHKDLRKEFFQIFLIPLINSIANLHNYYFHSSRERQKRNSSIIVIQPVLALLPSSLLATFVSRNELSEQKGLRVEFLSHREGISPGRRTVAGERKTMGRYVPPWRGGCKVWL